MPLVVFAFRLGNSALENEQPANTNILGSSERDLKLFVSDQTNIM